MPNFGILGQGGGIGPIKLLDASSSTDESTVASLPVPMSQFGFQVAAGSSDAICLLQGSVAESTDDSTRTTLITFDMSSDGSDGATQFVTGKPVSQLSATITGGASSGGLSAWFSATP